MSMLGIPVIQHRWLPDDQVILSTDPTRGGATVMLVGTMAPTDPVKLAGRDARLLVRRGLADVLAWLGQPVVNEPVLARLRAIGQPVNEAEPIQYRVDHLYRRGLYWQTCLDLRAANDPDIVSRVEALSDTELCDPSAVAAAWRNQ